MTKVSKRHHENKGLVDPESRYELQEAISILKNSVNVKFNESVDVAINLGVDSKQSDQNVRGSALLPNGTGNTM